MDEQYHRNSYHAKTGYQFNEAASGYEQRPYYRGILGRYRKYRETQAIQAATQQFMRDSVIVDCPCGPGRWFPCLGMRARLIIGIDISEVMIEAAKRSPVAQTGRASLDVRLGDAEGIDLEDNSVDHVFSYALMKHLPPDVKVTVMREFARISTGRIAVSFGVFNPLGRLLWKMKGMHEWPVTWGDIQHLASVTSMDIGAVYKVGVPICGMEYVVVFERRLN